jgi:hypothetical protein
MFKVQVGLCYLMDGICLLCTFGFYNPNHSDEAKEILQKYIDKKDTYTKDIRCRLGFHKYVYTECFFTRHKYVYNKVFLQNVSPNIEYRCERCGKLGQVDY